MLYVSNKQLELVEITDTETGVSEWMSVENCYARYCVNNEQLALKVNRSAVLGLYFMYTSPNTYYVNVLSESDVNATIELKKKYKADLARLRLIGLQDCKLVASFIDTKSRVLENTVLHNNKFYIPSYVNILYCSCLEESPKYDEDQGYDLTIPSNIEIALPNWCQNLRHVRDIIFEGDLLYVDLKGGLGYSSVSRIVFKGDIQCIEAATNSEFPSSFTIELRKEVYEKHKQEFDKLKGIAVIKFIHQGSDYIK